MHTPHWPRARAKGLHGLCSPEAGSREQSLKWVFITPAASRARGGAALSRPRLTPQATPHGPLLRGSCAATRSRLRPRVCRLLPASWETRPCYGGGGGHAVKTTGVHLTIYQRSLRHSVSPALLPPVRLSSTGTSPSPFQLRSMSPGQGRTGSPSCHLPPGSALRSFRHFLGAPPCRSLGPTSQRRQLSAQRRA